MDSLIQTLIAIAVLLSTIVLSIKAYFRKDWGMVGAIIPRLYLLGVILVDIVTDFQIPNTYFHLGILIVLLGDFISNLFIILSPRFHVEIYTLHLMELLKNLKVKYDFVVEHAPIGIYVLDEFGNFEFINDAFTRLTGYCKDDLLGHSVLMIVPDKNKEQISKNLRERIENIAQTANYTTELITKNGGILKVQVNARRTENGHPTITGCITKV